MEPAWIEPCIPTLVKTPPIGADWLHEINGYRAISVIDRGRAKIFTRRGHDWSPRMPSIKGLSAAIKSGAGHQPRLGLTFRRDGRASRIA